MRKVRNLSLVFGAMFLLITINACEDFGNSQSDKPAIANPTDYTAILDLLDLGEVSEFIEEESSLKSTSESDAERCFDVTIHDNGTDEFWPRSWTFSFTDSTCENYFGNIRLGSIHVSLTDFWKKEGSTRTVTFEDYSINGNKIEGTKTIKNTGLNDAGNMTFERSTENASFTRGDTVTISWECNKNVEMIAGQETFQVRDDEYLVSGGAEGVNYEGVAYSIDITTPLHYKKCSRFPVSGTIEITVEGNAPATVDYGAGECDNSASITVNGETTEITLGETNLL